MHDFAKYSILIIAMAVGLVSCVQSHEKKILKAAETIMEENPDSALQLLNTIPKGMLTEEADRAKFNLLFCQANVKINNWATSIDSIKFSCDYYRRHNEKRDLMKSQFYVAQLYFFNLFDSENAIDYAVQAYDLANELNDDYWIAKSSEELSDIYNFKMNQKQALRFSLKAADYYNRVGKELNVRYALVAAARAMLASREIQRGVQLLDSILALANAERDSGLALQCYEGLLLASVVKHDYKNGFRYFDEYRKNPYCVYDYEDDVSYLYLKIYSGDTTGVKSSIESIRPMCKSDREKARLANLEYETAKLLDNPEYIVSSADSLRKHTDGYLEEGIINSVSSEERDFYSGKAESESKVRHNQLSVAMICIIVVVILAVVIAIAFRKRLKHRNELIVRKQRDIDTLNNTLEYNIDQKQQLENRVREKEEVIASLISMLDDLSKSQTQDGVSTDSLSSKEAYIEKWTLFNSLFDDYFRMHDSSASVSRQLRPFTDFVSRIQSKEYLDKIRQSVDKYMGGIVTRLIDECPWLKEEDILLLTLSYAGISPRAIALIMNMQLRSMYNKRNRLIKLIIKNCPPDAAEFTDIPKPIVSE